VSNGPPGRKWRFLIVEDDPDKVRQLEEILPACVDKPDEVQATVCSSFKDAVDQLELANFDLLILDLRDDSDTSLEAESNPAGLEVLEVLKKTRFVPVVFWTALPHKVRADETTFVRVVEKTEDVTRVREEVRSIMATKLPALSRRIEEIQRRYMWDFVAKQWKEFDSPHAQTDLAYLLARRLALSLQAEARRLGRDIAGKDVPMADKTKVHPMQMYIRPPIADCRLSGDILSGTVGAEKGLWIVLTPSCDFEQKGRLHNVLLAQCLPLTEEVEFKEWKQDASEKNLESLSALIGDNRKGAQAGRFKFLPGVFFLPDSVVDFQRLKMVSPAELEKLEVVASLDSPFAEALLAKFTRYFGRLGTPDIDKQVVLDRLQNPEHPK
jgi:CheY-like chemotaxis protein